jgi:heptosyltransferase I
MTLRKKTKVFRNMTVDYRNILIIKPSALGDIVHALPILAPLRAAFPKAKLAWLVRTEFAPLLACTDGVDEVLLFDRKGMAGWFYCPAAFAALRAFTRTLRHRRFDLVLDLQGLLRTALFARMTGCATRVGMADAREGARLFYTHAVANTQSLHVLDTYHALLKAVGVETDNTRCRLTPPAEAVAAVRAKLAATPVSNGRYCVLIPSAAHASKCWPAERFAKVAERIHQRFGWTAVATGTAADRPIIEAIARQCRVPIVDLSGRTGIPELVALLAGAAAVVSNDTGPGHIAEALTVPTVLVFGHTNPMRVGPYGHPERVAAIDPTRRPATIASRDPAHRIDQVPVETVTDRLFEQLTPNPERAAE